MTAHLLPILEKLSGHRVLCIGDIMVDRFVYGQVSRISPEAPIPVILKKREAIMLGGSGNVVRNIVALGGLVDMLGVVGKDQAGYELEEQVAAVSQITSYVLTDNSRPTTVKTRYIADGQQLLRADSEINSSISADMEQEIITRARGVVGNCDIVILSDYAKGVLTNRVVSELIRIAAAAGKKVLVDPKGRDFAKYRGAYMITPNRKELSEATGRNIESVADAEKSARELIAANNLQGVLAKLGGDGVCLVMKDKEAKHFKATAREVYDVSGAGDTVVAAMSLALAGGILPEDGAAISNLAGSVVVGKIGTAVVTCDDLAQELMKDAALSSEEKIMTRARAAEKAEEWRRQGFKVGFTNGCFDLLHPGHIHSIRQAKAACDRLIMGLNSDASVKRLKGENRPVQNEESRAIVLASLADVSGIVIFDEDTPYDLIKTIRPDILVKGADYTIDKVVGADLVQGWGGKVVLVELVEGQSTTSTIKKMKD